jgi:hypothetical protein|tara:strand:- start:1699 stop:1905 length:207 start_codon:yes stop_codon:yes gene_type:complete
MKPEQIKEIKERYKIASQKKRNSDDEYIRKAMMKVKGGEFYNWYKNLPGYLQRAYKREFNKLQTKYER